MDLMDSPSDLSYGASGPLFRIWSINSLLQSNVNADSHLDLSLKAQRILRESSDFEKNRSSQFEKKTSLEKSINEERRLDFSLTI